MLTVTVVAVGDLGDTVAGETAQTTPGDPLEHDSETVPV
jgi:hypothetical protein